MAFVVYYEDRPKAMEDEATVSDFCEEIGVTFNNVVVSVNGIEVSDPEKELCSGDVLATSPKKNKSGA